MNKTTNKSKIIGAIWKVNNFLEKTADTILTRIISRTQEKSDEIIQSYAFQGKKVISKLDLGEIIYLMSYELKFLSETQRTYSVNIHSDASNFIEQDSTNLEKIKKLQEQLRDVDVVNNEIQMQLRKVKGILNQIKIEDRKTFT